MNKEKETEPKSLKLLTQKQIIKKKKTVMDVNASVARFTPQDRLREAGRLLLSEKSTLFLSVQL